MTSFPSLPSYPQPQLPWVVQIHTALSTSQLSDPGINAVYSTSFCQLDTKLESSENRTVVKEVPPSDWPAGTLVGHPLE